MFWFSRPALLTAVGSISRSSLFRHAYFQNARYNYIIPMPSYGYKKRSDRTTHDDAVTSPHTSRPKAIRCPQAFKLIRQRTRCKHITCSKVELHGPEQNNQDCMSCASAEWMDGCGAASAAETRACESPCARVYAALRLRNTLTIAQCVPYSSYITQCIIRLYYW